METAIVIAILIIILGLATYYVIRAKKNGQKCVGCPHAKECCKKNCK